MKRKLLYVALSSVLCLTACSDDDPAAIDGGSGNGELSEEWYSGGKLGTVFGVTYEEMAPAVENSGMSEAFVRGEVFFEKVFTQGEEGPRSGLGPAWIRNSCIACHPRYGHGQRKERYQANDDGNGYLLVVYDKDTQAYVPELTGMPQTRASYPFQPPIDEAGIKISWLSHTDEYNNAFPDGETYNLIYPEVTIDPAYIHTDPKPTNYEVRLESTIGIYGSGLLDAISDKDLLAQYESEKSLGYFELNDAKYQPENFIKEADGTSHPGRFTYGLTRGTLQNGPGSNAIWNITNVTRSDRTYLYTTNAWAKAMSQNEEVQSKLGQDQATIYNSLIPSKEVIHKAEMTDEDYIDFMIWHRGVAVPAARNLDDADVQKGKKLFTEIGCAVCHRPSWTTREDHYSGDPLVAGKLPKYPNQKIWPYSDLLQHKLDMKNDIRTGWCRTTPLWGRGLSKEITGASDRLHDCRARNEIEAIMWHGGDGKHAKGKFYNLSKKDRDAVVKFIQSI